MCSGRTGHAEVIQIEFDPARVSYDQLLEVFWAAHDPTTLNRQGNDVGTQYRSGIYTESEDDAQQARAYIDELTKARAFAAPIVTEVQPLAMYSAAEAYHQDYFEHHPHQGYCAFVVAPKVHKLEKGFSHWLKG